MPRFCLETNVKASRIPENFLQICVKTLAKLMGKEESFCVGVLQTDQDMIFGDDCEEPCGIVNVSSIGGLGVDDIKRHSDVFSQLIEEYVGIPRKRLWITFTENLPEFVTFKGVSFYHLVMCRAPGTNPVVPSPNK